MQARIARGRASFWVRSCSFAYLAVIAAPALAQGETPASGPELALEEVLAHAQQHSPLLRAARARSALGDAALTGASPALRDNPELEIGAGPRKGAAEDVALDVRLRLQQRVELSGQRGARIAAAEALQTALEQRLAAVRFAIRVGVRAGYAEALLARAHASSAREIEQVEARIAEIASARARAGEIGPLGARLAEADLAQATQARLAAESEESTALLRLTEIAGLASDPLPALRGTLPAPTESPDVQFLIEHARDAQPQRRVALAELAEQESRMRVASREAWNGPAFGLEFAHEGGRDNVALATVSVPLPLFARNQGARAQTSAERDVLQAELAADDAARPARIRALAITLRAAQQRIEVYARDVWPRFAENLELLRRAFELGEIDALEVSNARARMAEAQRGALSAYADYFRALRDLQIETGWEAAAP